MFIPAWAVITIIATGSQTLRNALQRDLIATIGTVGATHARFLYGLPFGILFLILVTAATGVSPVMPNAGFLLWVTFGAIAQIFATALMLSAMRDKSFLVTIAYTKAEPVEIALFGLLLLNEVPTPLLILAIAIATSGVLIMSWPKRSEAAGTLRPALSGIIAGGCFGLGAVGFKGGILATGLPFLPAATETLVASLAIQTAILTVYLVIFDKAALVRLAKAWKPSLPAGFFGAFASQLWFLAFAMEPVAHVRTLGLVEILFSAAVSRNLLKQVTSPREAIGIVLLIIGVLIVLNL